MSYALGRSGARFKATWAPSRFVGYLNESEQPHLKRRHGWFGPYRRVEFPDKGAVGLVRSYGERNSIVLHWRWYVLLW